MTLRRERIQQLLDQRIDERLNIGAALHVYMRRHDRPAISAERRLLQA